MRVSWDPPARSGVQGCFGLGRQRGSQSSGLIDKGALSLAFLDAPVMALPERLDRSCEELAAERGAPMSLVQALHQSLGFAPPEPGDMAGEDDATMLEVARLFRGAGATDDATLRLLAVYADNLRRIAKAESDYYEANIERRLRAEGLDERQMIELPRHPARRPGHRVVGASAPDGLPAPSRSISGPSTPSTTSRRHLRVRVSNNECRSHQLSALST